MLGLDWSNHRIIGITIALGIILISITAIIVRFYIHKRANKINNDIKDDKGISEDKKEP